MKSKLLRQLGDKSGATSLLLVVGISLVFVTIITGLTTLSIRESQQAVSNDLSNRALVAAESAVKKTVQELEKNPLASLPTNCGNTIAPEYPVSYSVDESSENQTQIVCRTVQTGGTSQLQHIDKDKSALIYPKGDNNANLLTIKWGLKDDLAIPAVPESCQTIDLGGRKIPVPGRCQEAQAPVNAEPLPNDYIPYAEPSTNNPALVEVTAFSYPNGGSSGADNKLDVKTILITPLGTPRDMTGNLAAAVNDSSKCNDSVDSEYLCIANINLNVLVPSSNKLLAIQFKPRFKETGIQTQLFNSTDLNTPLQAGQSVATIDVTAKVGDYYRRVQVDKPLSVNQLSNSYFTDVLYSNKTICKSLTIAENGDLAGSNFCTFTIGGN